MSRDLARLVLAALALLAPFGARNAGAADDAAFGRYLAGTCVTCHATSDQATAGIPSIVGWPQDRFKAAVLAYRNGERDHTIMKTMVDPLGDEEVAALADYFGSLPQQSQRK